MADNSFTSSLSYTGRSAETIREDLISFAGKITGKPSAWTDYNESDLGMVILELIAGGQDLQNFYFDEQAFETYLDTAQQEYNLRSIFRAMNYRIPFMGSATGTVKVVVPEGVDNIPVERYTQLVCENNDYKYAVSDDVVLKSGDNYIDVKEGVVRTFTVTRKELLNNKSASGDISRRIYLKGGDSKYYSDRSLWIHETDDYIGSNDNIVFWQEVDDALLEYNGGKYYSLHQDSKGETYILMSVDFIEYLPTDENEEVTIQWLQTLGTKGTAVPGTPTEIVRFEKVPRDLGLAEVIQEESTANAYDQPDLLKLKPIVRREAQTLGRYITIDDYRNGVDGEPYIFWSVVKDWKTPKYVSIPYQVKVWALDENAKNLNTQSIKTLKDKLYAKGVTDIEVIYVVTQFVKVRFDVDLILQTSSESNSKAIRSSVYSQLSEMWQVGNLYYGYKFSYSYIISQILEVSSYIKDVSLLMYRGEVINITNSPVYEEFNIPSIDTDTTLTIEEKIEKVKELVNTDQREISNDYPTTITSVNELEVITWVVSSEIALDEIEYPEIYRLTVTSTSQDSKVSL